VAGGHARRGGGGGAPTPPPPLCPPPRPQHMPFGESLSTAKGAAALRLRSSTLRRTGFMEGRVTGMASGAGAARAPAS
jgi:hypothetical protein